MATYEKAADATTGRSVVVQITPTPNYTVVAVCESSTRATQIAALLTADEA